MPKIYICQKDKTLQLFNKDNLMPIALLILATILFCKSNLQDRIYVTFPLDNL